MSDPFSTADWEKLLGSVAQIRERLVAGDLAEAMPVEACAAAAFFVTCIERSFEHSDSRLALSMARKLATVLEPYVTIPPMETPDV